jgi:hypothetical protein
MITMIIVCDATRNVLCFCAPLSISLFAGVSFFSTWLIFYAFCTLQELLVSVDTEGAMESVEGSLFVDALSAPTSLF